MRLSSMIVAGPKEAIQWSLDLGIDSIILTVKDLVHELTISSGKNLVPAWNLSFS